MTAMRSCLVIHPDTGTTCHFDHPSHQKPVPPDGLWQQLDAALLEANNVVRLPNSFTCQEFAERKKLTHSVAAKQIHKLVAAGKVTKHGAGNKVYYQLVK